MKLTYLGTAAAEGFPAIFCNCKYCVEARIKGGKNIRTRSQSLINDDLLIDFPADTYHHFLQNGIEGDKIKYLLITHSHGDHFQADDLLFRHGAFAHDMREEKLELFASEALCSSFDKTPKNVEIHPVFPYKQVKIGRYLVTPLPARHDPYSSPYIYVIEGEKRILYAHDTGYFFEEVFDYIEKNKVFFDMVSFDCCNVDIPIPDDGGHMGFANIERVLQRLENMGAVNASTVKYVNHFSHNANPIHDLLVENAKKYGCLVSYDGCTVDI